MDVGTMHLPYPAHLCWLKPTGKLGLSTRPYWMVTPSGIVFLSRRHDACLPHGRLASMAAGGEAERFAQETEHMVTFDEKTEFWNGL